ncbi:hypothetical protein SNEBB_006195 [Seison nebaliae]|nr:hypothetical protein SNEBB_006195 [Seison nebaliae]
MNFNFYLLYFIFALHNFFVLECSVIYDDNVNDAKYQLALDQNEKLEIHKKSSIYNLLVDDFEDVLRIAGRRIQQIFQPKLNRQLPKKTFKGVKISEGGQGKVFLVSKATGEKYVTKTMEEPGEVLMEANAMLAFELNPVGSWHTYKILGISHGKLVGERSEKLLERRISNRVQEVTHTVSYTFVGQQFCIDMSHVDGQEVEDLAIYRSNLSQNPKEFYTFLILILRQIQALHFSLNKIPIVKMALFDVGSYANAHNDLHIYNIIMTENKEHYFNREEGKIPIIIDYALEPFALYRKYDDITIGVYNMNLRKEKKIEELNRIHKNRLLNSMQGIDFCTLAVLFANVLTNTVEESGPESVYYCSNLKDNLFPYESYATSRQGFNLTMRHIPFINNVELRPISGILGLLFDSMMQFQTYNSWIKLVNYFQTDEFK